MTTLEDIYRSSPIFMQTILLNGKALELYFERYGKKFQKLYNEFETNQRLTSSELEDYQSEKLIKLVRHAYDSVPYYNRLFRDTGLKPEDIRSIQDLHKIPVLTKQDIRDNFDALISKSVNPKQIRKGNTSGTTGTPLNVLYDINTCVVHHVADRRQKEWAGMKWGEPYASLQGRVIVPTEQTKPPFWRKNYINNQLFLSSFHLKKDNLQAYFDKLAKDNIKFIEGYPSTIYTLATYLNNTGQTFPMKATLTSSETLYSWQRAAIEKAFACKNFDFYGMAERVVYASECSHHSGHHLNSDYGITEFLGPDNEPITEKGKVGKIVATSLHNYAFPLIRYVTNDSCALKTKACECGVAFPLMDDVTTKNESIISLPDGRLISPSVLTHPFKPMENIESSQIIQEDLYNLTVKIVKRPNFTNDDETVLLNGFKDRLGTEIKVRVEYVNEIEKTKNGKLKWVISRVKPNI